MTPTTPRHSAEEMARIGTEIFERRVRPTLKPEDDGKYVAIDITTEEFEIDNNDYFALSRLRVRQGTTQIWIVRINKPYHLSYRMRLAQ